MIDFFYSIKFRIGCNRICSVWNHFVSFVFNLLYPLYCRMKPVRDGLNYDEPRENKIIISLTSFPARLGSVHYCIRALLAQTCKPDRIILWLMKEECKDFLLPQSLIELTNFGLEIQYADDNLRPHNKLYHTLKDNPDAIVITVDDDCIYPSYLVERLYNAYKKYPKVICCNMAHEILLKGNLPDLYDRWNGGAIGKKGFSDRFVALGVGGVLYPPHCFDEEYFDQNLIRSLALTADDLWLKYTELRLHIPVYKIAAHAKIPFVIKNTQREALGHTNNGLKRNDRIMQNLCEHDRVTWNILLLEDEKGEL